MIRPEEAMERFLPVREFRDGRGRDWMAGVRARPGLDVKGRFFFVARPKDGQSTDEVWLEDVRWNSEETAERSLKTMSGVELRRRLRSAMGRSSHLV
jgi:hypothetical protein